jgi:hypothetical protein
MGVRDVFARMATLGAGSQSLVAGTYAWASTVAPVAWSRGGGALSRTAAVVALLALGAGWPARKRWGDRARIVASWSFVLCCALAWGTAPEALNGARVDTLAGLTGSLAWGLFALASAAPALEALAGQGSEDDPLPPRRRLPGREGRVVLAGAVLAVTMQAFGWGMVGPERSLLTRLALLAAGLAIVDLAVNLAPRWPARAQGVLRLDRWYRRRR